MITRRSLVKGTGALGALAAGSVALTACGGSASPSASSASAESPQASAASSAAAQTSSASAGQAPAMAKNVVVFFSRAGENYEVGVVDEGNTAKVAHSIAGKVVSSVFEIVPVAEYPFSYDECVAQAQTELDSNARPAVSDQFAGFDEYSTIYLGYPIWHEHLPMIMRTFIESKNWNGKTVAPFCTYGSSGICNTVDEIRQLCAGATVKEGLAIKGADAQSMSMDTDSAINAWLAKVRA